MEWMQGQALEGMGASTGSWSAEDVQIVDVNPHQRRSQAREWIAHWEFLSKRLAIATQEASQPSETLKGFKDIWEEQAVSAKGLESLRKRLWAEVQQLKTLYGSVEAKVLNVRGDPQAVEALALAIDAMDAGLSRAKGKQGAAMAALQAEEATLEQEIEAIASRLEAELAAGGGGSAADAPAAGTGAGEAARTPSAARPASASRARAAASMRATPLPSSHPTTPHAPSHALAPEIKAFDDFCSRYGEHGGWEADDHAEFERVLKACRGDYAACVEYVSQRSIGFSKQELIDHANWHMDWVELLAAKREALAAWRAGRDAQRAALVAEAAVMGCESAQQAQDERSQLSRSASASSHLQSVRKELVHHWKAEKEARARAAEEAARSAAQERAERQAAERAARQAENKLRLELHKGAKDQAHKEAARRAATAHAITSALKAPTPHQLAAVARRSEATLARRQGLVAAKEESKGQRAKVQEKLLSQVRVCAPSDPSRLLKGTAAHMARVQEQASDERQARDSSYILHMNHGQRSVPSWRQGAQ